VSVGCNGCGQGVQFVFVCTVAISVSLDPKSAVSPSILLHLCPSFNCFLAELALLHLLVTWFGSQWGARGAHKAYNLFLCAPLPTLSLQTPKVPYLHQFCSVFALLVTVFSQNYLCSIFWWVDLVSVGCKGCKQGGTIRFCVHSDKLCLFRPPKMPYLHQCCSVCALLLTVFSQNYLGCILWWVGLSVSGFQSVQSAGTICFCVFYRGWRTLTKAENMLQTTKNQYFLRFHLSFRDH